jgi:ubiquitin carboxyl-terminal hydrolase 31
LETGHYTATCRNPYEGNWYKFDDQRVTQVAGEIDEIVRKEAYMLFYQRRKGDGSDISGRVSFLK